MKRATLSADRGGPKLQILIVFGAIFLLSIAASAQTDFHHLTFKVGGGVTPTTGAISGPLDTGWNFTAGAGYRFTRSFALIGEYQYNGLGVDRSVLNAFQVPGADAHVWSLTGNLRWDVIHDAKVTPYAIGGLGFYRRTVNFTQPTLAPGLFVDPFFGFVTTGLVPANQIIGTISRNGVGLNFGGGFAVKLGDTGTRFFTEARYHWADMPRTNTTLVPVTFGFRW